MKLRVLSLLLIAISAVAQTQPATLDETARFLAGMPVPGPLASLTQDPAWQDYSRTMNEAWLRKQQLQISPIHAWMQANAPEYYGSDATVFYMFGGPDFLYANIFYPNANTYILAGLEPIGGVPDLTQMPPEQVSANLAALQQSLSTILRVQYFITKEMREQLGTRVSGTLPLLYVFLARMGYAVLDVAPVSEPATGVKITFAAEGQPPQTLYYFKTDLSGSKQSAFLKWCAARGPGLSLLKAASFLLHGNNFDGVRNFLLWHSRVIIQDDSGIPLRAFPKGWTVNVYGNYVAHRTDFVKYTQLDLLALYQRPPRPTPLGFAFGYHWQREEGMLMLATPTASTTTTPRPPPTTEPRVLRAIPVEQNPQEIPVRKALPVPVPDDHEPH
ncbi:MAG: hypothetical protein M3R59_01750 [Verrucomicrobiota bacterium]|nr:hypothetical protein [Verrucomicrobiota bacterium]